MKNNLTLGLWMGLILSQSCLGITQSDIHEVLQYQIAKEGITRISVENDEIEDVYVYPFQFTDNVKIHKTGQLFVVSDHMDRSVYLTLITKRGFTHDLQINPFEKKPEPIILKLSDSSEIQKNETDQITLILEKFIQGIQPSSFYSIDMEAESRSQGSISCILEKAYQQFPFRVLVYRVLNETHESVALNNRLFWEEGDLALAFNRLHIESHETAELYIIQKI
jgi:hypothetical protein